MVYFSLIVILPFSLPLTPQGMDISQVLEAPVTSASMAAPVAGNFEVWGGNEVSNLFFFGNVTFGLLFNCLFVDSGMLQTQS